MEQEMKEFKLNGKKMRVYKNRYGIWELYLNDQDLKELLTTHNEGKK